jgi:hypothetical protein
VCDDAYISFRVADNFVHGYGLRWNVDERVAVFTHPLWLFAFSSAYVVTREAYYTALSLGIGFTLITIALVALRVAPGAAGALAVIGLLASKAFIDFSTSGLETPLTYLLLVIFVLDWAHFDDRPRRLARVWVIGACARQPTRSRGVDRPDARDRDDCIGQTFRTRTRDSSCGHRDGAIDRVDRVFDRVFRVPLSKYRVCEARCRCPFRGAHQARTLLF